MMGGSLVALLLCLPTWVVVARCWAAPCYDCCSVSVQEREDRAENRGEAAAGRGPEVQTSLGWRAEVHPGRSSAGHPPYDLLHQETRDDTSSRGPLREPPATISSLDINSCAVLYVQVEASMFVRSLGPVDMVTMQYEAAITLRQKWRDPRLAFTGQVECPG